MYDYPQITLYYSDTRHTYRGQSAANYLEIPVATITIRLTCEGSGVRWVTPSSESGNINDNQWGTLTINLLTVGETGLYKCYGAEGTSSVYIQAMGLGMYTIRSDRNTPERLYPGRNYFIEDTQDVNYEFFCLMSNPYSSNVPSWTYPKYVIGTVHEDSYVIESDVIQAITSLRVIEDNWNILLSGRYTCVGEDIDGVVMNVSINIWSHATPIQRTAITSAPITLTYPDNDITDKMVADTTTVASTQTETKQPTSTPTNTEIVIEEITSTTTDYEITTSQPGNFQKEDIMIKAGFALALLVAVLGWVFSMTIVCCLWCYIKKRRGLKRVSYKTSDKSLSYEEANGNSIENHLNPPSKKFSFNGYYPCTIRNFEKEPSPIGSNRFLRTSTPTYRVQSQEMLI
ncbi:hypothetical protein LOD99_9594 [Oopsacas minuta]|uniref:Ig-like domain-containing protein n=1 Tax=Oopsacas minuta TaxID=111878 RepID=A0AAV7KKN5_9METZ|nr:hypothetical protein LOD99_9594 [Oopsacas minuta]